MIKALKEINGGLKLENRMQIQTQVRQGKNDKNRLENKVGKRGVGAIGDCPYLPILSTFLAGEGAKCNRQTITEI